MKRIINLIVLAVLTLTLCISAFAAEALEEEKKDFIPIEGSWKLDKVFNVIDGQSQEEIKKEEAQSLYGTGINIFTFDKGGYAHDILLSETESIDTSAKWKTTKSNVYVYIEENGLEITFTYEAEKDVLHRIVEYSDEDATYKKLDFVYARAIIGSWKLDQVLEIHEDDATVKMTKEENQSLYAEDENILTFEVDGKVKKLIKAGNDETIEEGVWELTEPDKFVYTIGTVKTEMDYFRVDDYLFRDVKTEEDQLYLRFIYVRTDDFDGIYAGYNYTDDDFVEDGYVGYNNTYDGFDGGYAGYNNTYGDFEGGYDGYNYSVGADSVIVDYMQDEIPVYRDDPSIIGFDNDGIPR